MGTPARDADGSQEHAQAWPRSRRRGTVVTASRWCLVPQVRGTHLRQRPEIHPGLLRGQGPCHGAQDRCPENSPGGTTLRPTAAGRWVGSSSRGTGGEEKGAGSAACVAGTPRPLLCSSALHRGTWWGSCPMGCFAAPTPAGLAQHGRQWPALPTAMSAGSLPCGCPIPSHPSLPVHLPWAQLSCHLPPLFSATPGLLQQQGLPQHAHLPQRSQQRHPASQLAQEQRQPCCLR